MLPIRLIITDPPSAAEHQRWLAGAGVPGRSLLEEPTLASGQPAAGGAPQERPAPLRVDSTGAAAPQLPQQQQQPNLPPLAFDVRLPPLHPKLASQLYLLAAGHGSLFAGAAPRAGGDSLFAVAHAGGMARCLNLHIELMMPLTVFELIQVGAFCSADVV